MQEQTKPWMWNREQAFWVIERLEPLLANVGAHCALNGSVLYRGSSTKDLDLIVYPHNSVIGETWDTYPLKHIIREFFHWPFIVTSKMLARRFGVSQACIKFVLARRNWRHI